MLYIKVCVIDSGNHCHSIYKLAVLNFQPLVSHWLNILNKLCSVAICSTMVSFSLIAPLYSHVPSANGTVHTFLYSIDSETCIRPPRGPTKYPYTQVVFICRLNSMECIHIGPCNMWSEFRFSTTSYLETDEYCQVRYWQLAAYVIKRSGLLVSGCDIGKWQREFCHVHHYKSRSAY